MNDPTVHPGARSHFDNAITYNCGCVNEIHRPSGVLHSVEKCEGHRREQRAPETLGRAYYEDLHAIEDGIPQCSRYLREIEEALGPFPPHRRADDGVALEIGCGVSMYAPAILKAGYSYVAVEPSEWAARCTSNMYDVPVIVGTFEDLVADDGSFSLILAAHSLEHAGDAPNAIGKCARLMSTGAELWIVIPNDDDPLNPEHLWFFDEDTLLSCLTGAGLVVDDFQSKRRIERECFLYARARKPWT